MNKKFLNKVIKQVVSETIMDFTAGNMYTPFLPPHCSSIHILSCSLVSCVFNPFSPFKFFPEHCKNVYALNDKEIDYVWKEYGNIIHDKIKNEQEVSK